MTDHQARAQAAPVRPINADLPITFPVALPSSLSEDAQTLYGSGRQRKIDRDWFAHRAGSRWVTDDQAAEYEPTDRDRAAIAEIVAARLGRYDEHHQTLHLTAVDEHYTVAWGRGSQLIKVSLFEEYVTERRLMAVLVGADLETRGPSRGDLPEIAVQARHDNATDVEHDASSTALLRVLNPTAPSFRGYGSTSFSGVLVSAQLYPLGTDLLLQHDADTQAGQTCTDCEVPHPFAPYLPPAAEQLVTPGSPRFVHVECWPIRPFLVSAI